MKKKNPLLAQIEARHQAELKFSRLFTVQQSKDMMLIAANEAFGFGPERSKVLSDAFDRVFQEYALATMEDAKYDKDIWFIREKLDQKLKSICGEHFVPWEERYR